MPLPRLLIGVIRTEFDAVNRRGAPMRISRRTRIERREKDRGRLEVQP